MKTLLIGIASFEEIKSRTMAVARGEHRISRTEPKVWFTSTESFAKVLSATIQPHAARPASIAGRYPFR